MNDAPAQTYSRRFVVAMAAAVLLAAAIRAPFLTDSLWYDEIAAFLGYSINGPWGAVSTYYTQANHVLHSLLAWGAGAALEWMKSPCDYQVSLLVLAPFWRWRGLP